MPWIQNGTVILVFFLFARMFIHRRMHLHLIDLVRSGHATGISAMAKWIMSVAYAMSLFFPNTIVVLACLPVIRDMLHSLDPGPLRQRGATQLGLALIYGANIGGMGSITGSPLNLVFFGFLEFHKVPGYAQVTFFTWLLVGIPLTLVLLGAGLLVVGRHSETLHISRSILPGEHPPADASLGRFFRLAAIVAVLMIALSAIQFVAKPVAIFSGLNGVDWAYLVILFGVTGYAFILPHRSWHWRQFGRNTAYLLLNLALFPLIYVVETFREIRIRLYPRGVERTGLEWIPDHVAAFAWRRLSKRPIRGGIRAPYNEARVGINNMIYDLPFFGLFFMGLVMLVVFLLVRLGDNPATEALDGVAVQAMEWLTSCLLSPGASPLMLLAVLVVLSVFLTELVNNTVVVLLMFQVILNWPSVGGVSALWAMAAVTLASSAAFMTPVATSVNAVVFAGIRGVSLRRMLMQGLLMNLISAGWLILAFYFLSSMPFSWGG